MATVYYRHERVNWVCHLLVIYTNKKAAFAIMDLQLEEDDPFYLCVVHNGKVYAGRELRSSHSGGSMKLVCDDFTDNETGKQILLKHLLLGE